MLIKRNTMGLLVSIYIFLSSFGIVDPSSGNKIVDPSSGNKSSIVDPSSGNKVDPSSGNKVDPSSGN